MLFNNFIDKISLICISGNGGHGCVHFLKKNKKIGKPDGGNGGNGGKIIFVGDKNLFTLYNFKDKRIYKAENGFHGMRNCKTGKNGKNLIIKIPLYTILSYKKNNKSKKVIIKKENQKKVIILGGKGGKGNNYYKNSKNQKSKNFSLGEKGNKLIIKLKLQLKIDIGIIGYPNTGKSTILSILTSNKPKIADYNYTTIIPNIGIYYKDYKKYIVMDIPAIYLHNGTLITNKYIKYLKYCKLILIIMSINNIKEYINNYFFINKVINNYKIKNKIIIISKSDYIKKKNIFLLKQYFKEKKKKENILFFYNNKTKNKKKLKKQINKIL
ncbi:MAG: 50S ribosome-binding GTPase [Candidatus Shikimatogenerans bostrichidophilus]|nr:MAG: 50S ribosome-binding GTPase [Candidatus Shikimatogenerans bostrichidophilus]